MKHKIVEVLESQHSCFVFEDGDTVVTVYSKRKKRMRRFEVGIWLDLAKADLMEKVMGK